jgi:hypothetical protein
VQFHVEVSEAMATEWGDVPAYAEYADRVLGDGGIDRVMADFRAREADMRSVARAMFESWVELSAPVAG